MPANCTTMKTTNLLLLAALGVTGYFVVEKISTRHELARASVPVQASLTANRPNAGNPAAPDLGVQPPVEPTPAPDKPTEPAADPSPAPPTATAPPKATSTASLPPPASAGRTGKPELADPAAREALSLVGADPMAEAYWVEAINDSSLPAHERQDLIEDLNEEGFEDPKHPTADDLPLILSRLAIIDVLAPDAMDDVNSDAFQEAQKDLFKMAARVMGEMTP